MKFIDSIKKIQKYDYFLIDQWGVIHDGKKKFLHAYKALNYLKKKKKRLIIISNSSENIDYTKRKTLKRLKINYKIFDKILTSGEVFEEEIDLIKKRFKKKELYCLHISHLNKKKYFEKKKIKIIKDIEKIDFILASSINPGLNLNKLKNILLKCKSRNKLMVCTNPDEKVFDGKVKKTVNQVGVLAKFYKKLGGKVIYYGKPYTKIYSKCFTDYSKINKKKILMIGDSIEKDILGAQNYKIDSLLILNGNHKKEFLGLKIDGIKRKIRNNWKNIKPTYISKNFNI